MASLFGSLDTAVSGLTSQSAAFSNISDNVANSQTVGFKETDTAFLDYLTSSSALDNESGDTVARPEYQNNVQGTIAQSQDTLAMAIGGQGFFPVSIPTVASVAGSNAPPVFSPLAGFTRAGDFSMNQQGYLVNSAGNYLNGWPYTSTGTSPTLDTTTLKPVQVSQASDNPVATQNITLSANLPAEPPGTSGSTTVTYKSVATIYDTQGTAHPVDLIWTPNPSGTYVAANGVGPVDSWELQIVSQDDQSGSETMYTDPTTGTQYPVIGSAIVSFAADGSINGIASGQINGNDGETTNVPTTQTAGSAATLSFQTNLTGVSGTPNLQTINLNLGTFGATTGMTQFAGTTYTQNTLTQDGTPPGLFSSVSTTSSGDIVVNYSNGQSRAIYRVPIATFNSPDGLQRQNGEVFTATLASGNPTILQAGTEGAGTIATSSVENSNVDIATEFSKLIVAQQAYGANAKIVTTANTLLQTTLDMKQ